MREGWVEVELGEVLSQVQRPVATSGQSTIPFAGVRWYAEGVYRRDELDASEVKTKSLNRLEEGDITYNRMWATKAAFGVVGVEVEGCLVTNDFPIFEANEDRLLPGFFELITKTTGFQSDASLLATGTTERRRLKERDFIRIRVLLPPLAEQRRIVDLIGAVDKYLASREAELEAGLNARAAALTEELGRAGDDWIEMTLSELLSLEYGKALKEADRDGGIFPVLGSAGVSGSHSSSLTGDGPSIVVGRKGTAGSVHWVGGPSWAIDTAYFVRLKTAADLRFTFFLLQNLDLPSLCAQTGVPGLNRDRAHEQPCKVPPLSEQQRIAEFIGAFDEANDALRAEVEAVRSSRAALLAELLSGDYEIPESYDTLLERAS